MINVVKQAIEKRWYSDSPGILIALLPLMYAYLMLLAFNSAAQQKRRKQSKVPVVVIGNITVGGTGKTPVIIALARCFREKGLAVGVVSRGYGRKNKALSFVEPNSLPSEVGDEPLEIWHALNCSGKAVPIAVASDRSAAVAALENAFSLDVILSDDGLQHYAMARQIEVCVVNQHHGFGNRYCLPVGPLREKIERLKKVDFTLVNMTSERSSSQVDTLVDTANTYFFSLIAHSFRSVRRSSNPKHIALGAFKATQVNAVAGIGQPLRFFNSLRALQLKVHEHPFTDHHRFVPTDLCFENSKNDEMPIIMTAKDAVKCRDFAPENSWCLEVYAELPEPFTTALLNKLHCL